MVHSTDLIPVSGLDTKAKTWQFKAADASKFETVEPGKYRYTVESGNTPGNIFNAAKRIAQQNGQELTARNHQELLKENNVGKSFRAGQVLVFQTRPKDGGAPAPQIPTQDTYVPSRPAQQAALPQPATAAKPLSAGERKQLQRIVSDPKTSKPEKAKALVALQIDLVKRNPKTLNFRETLAYLKLRCDPANAKRLEQMGVKPIDVKTVEGAREAVEIMNDAIARHVEDATGDDYESLCRNLTMEINNASDMKKLPLSANGKRQANCHIYAKLYALLFKSAGLKTHFYASFVSVSGADAMGHLNTVADGGKFMIISNNGKAKVVESGYSRSAASAHVKTMIINGLKTSAEAKAERLLGKDLSPGKVQVTDVYPEQKSFKILNALMNKKENVHQTKGALAQSLKDFNAKLHTTSVISQISTEQFVKIISADFKTSNGGFECPQPYKYSLQSLYRWEEQVGKLAKSLDVIKVNASKLGKADFPLSLEVIGKEGQPINKTFKNREQLNKYISDLGKLIDDARYACSLHVINLRAQIAQGNA